MDSVPDEGDLKEGEEWEDAPREQVDVGQTRPNWKGQYTSKHGSLHCKISWPIPRPLLVLE